MANIVRKTYSVDASGKIVGRLASEIAMHLMGKTNVGYLPNVDAGDFVVVTNAGGLKVTGKKMEQKVYQHHTNHPGGLKTKSMAKVWAEDPTSVLRRAVSRMLPKTKHRTARLLRLTITS
ncbi:MAG: 50S ribosomal protein L13 [Patescibacteria group bacterium]